MNHQPTIGFVPIGGLFVCNCGMPLARKISHNGWEIIKNYSRERAAINVQMQDGLIQCPVCKRGFAQLTVSESIHINDEVSVAGTPALGVE